MTEEAKVDPVSTTTSKPKSLENQAVHTTVYNGISFTDALCIGIVAGITSHLVGKLYDLSKN